MSEIKRDQEVLRERQAEIEKRLAIIERRRAILTHDDSLPKSGGGKDDRLDSGGRHKPARRMYRSPDDKRLELENSPGRLQVDKTEHDQRIAGISSPGDVTRGAVAFCSYPRALRYRSMGASRRPTI